MPPTDVPDAIRAHQAELDALAVGDREGESPFGRLGDDLEEHLVSLKQPVEAAAVTGLRDLDAVLKMRPGTLIAVAGRPTMGKSALTLGVAVANAASGRPTVVHPLEMGKPEDTNRTLAARARVGLHHLMDGGPSVTDADWARPLKVTPDLAALPL